MLPPTARPIARPLRVEFPVTSMYIASDASAESCGLREQREPRYRVERRLLFRPLDGGVFDPERGVAALALIESCFGTSRN